MKPFYQAVQQDHESCLAGQEAREQQARVYRVGALAGLSILLLVISGACICCMGKPRALSSNGQVSLADCLLPLGGGAAQKGGTFSHFSYASCKLLLDNYFAPDGLYYAQVQHVAEAAVAYVKQRPQTPTHQQVFTFDIDETTLSNVEEWTTPAHPKPAGGRWMPAWSWMMGAAKPDLTQEADVTQDHVGTGATGGAGESSSGGSMQGFVGLPAALRGDLSNAADSPPLLAVRELYWWLLEHNYSVAFITGRKESARELTAHNLLAAGYGKLCGSPDTRLTPCYVALHLREEDDDRPASVYKPERRKALIDQGYELVGNIGDQFSDLEGLWVAESSWKLPNPMYYIL